MLYRIKSTFIELSLFFHSSYSLTAPLWFSSSLLSLLSAEEASLAEQVRRIKDIEAIESDSFVPQAFKSSRDAPKVRVSLPASLFFFFFFSFSPFFHLLHVSSCSPLWFDLPLDVPRFRLSTDGMVPIQCRLWSVRRRTKARAALKQLRWTPSSHPGAHVQPPKLDLWQMLADPHRRRQKEDARNGPVW